MPEPPGAAIRPRKIPAHLEARVRDGRDHELGDPIAAADGHRPLAEVHRHHRDLSLREVVILVPVLAAILAFGVYPKLVLDRIEPTTDAIVTDVGAPPVTPAPSLPLAAEPGG